jgi:uncharacterized protein (DUF2141 family)
VTGTVVDEAGDPVTGTSVRALRRVVSGRSVRLLATGQIGSTDDRGIYRLSGLTQGEYLIMLPSSTTTMPVSTIDAMQTIQAAGSGESDRLFAEQLNASGAPYPNSSGVRVGDAYLQPGAMQGPGVGAFTSDRGTLVQPPIFFANAATAGTASIVALGPGEEKSGVDFQLNPVVARTVSGTLTGADGTVGNLGVRLVPANVDDFSSDSGMEVATTITGEQGQFTFLAVPPGSYVVRVLRIPRPALPNMIPGPNGSMQMAPRPPAGPPTEPTLFAQMPITVGDADLRGLSVALKTGPHVSGQVEFDGTPSAQSASRPQLITVNLTPADGRSLPGLMPAVAAVDGSFTTMSVPPGRYLINANTPGWILRSATANGRDASETPIDLESTDIGGVTITFFNRPAQVSGTVHDSRGNADDAASVLLFPADYRTWMQDGMSSRRYRTVQTTTNGRFSMSGLMPGDYLLVAVHDAQGPEIVEAVAPLALHVSLGESANQTQDLTSVQVPIR